MRKTKMDEIVENMANYICDHICQKPKEITDLDEMKDYCNGKCEMRKYFGDILKQYNEINDFEKSELYKIMCKFRNIVLCKECEYKVSHPGTDLSYCRLGSGMEGTLKENDGCSRGVKVSESDTSK